jgi:hypothetical protein
MQEANKKKLKQKYTTVLLWGPTPTFYRKKIHTTMASNTTGTKTYML